MSLLSVSEVAARMGVSEDRVRKLLAAGLLGGQRVGRIWLIDSAEADRIEQQNRSGGRPWSAASAWNVLRLAAGENPELSSKALHMARRRLQAGVAAVVDKVGIRAQRRSAYVHPAGLDRLRDDERVVIGGVDAAVLHGANLAHGDLELYLRAGDYEQVIHGYGMDESAIRPNVVLRIVEDDVWPFPAGVRRVGRLVAAVDLLESPDERAQRAGRDLLAER